MSSPRRLADLDEEQIITRLLRPFRRRRADRSASLRLGVGDDAAIVRPPPGQDVVVTSDAAVEGVDFIWRRFPAEAIGHRVLAQNLSDLAAMGAEPVGFLFNVVAPRGTPLARIDRVAVGVARLAAAASCPIIGGDLSATDGPAVLSITAMGRVARGRALVRSGARPGDQVWVSGALGGAAVALEHLLGAGRRLGRARVDLAPLLAPAPQLVLGRALRRHASACIDISDGLVRDLRRVAAASRVRIVIEVDRIPLAPGASAAQALASGEEYQLAFTAQPDRAVALRRLGRRHRLRLTPVGEVRAGRGVSAPGASDVPSGFDHFAVATTN